MMKKNFRIGIPVLLTAVLFFGCAGAPRQAGTAEQDYSSELSPEAEELMLTGIVHHDAGNYRKAIEYYSQALELSPGSPVIYYELAFSYMYMGEPEKALEWIDAGLVKAEKAVKESRLAGPAGKDELVAVLAGLYELKASALDDLERREEAVQVYLETIGRFGVSDTSLIYYNLGVTYYRMEKINEAREALVKGLVINPFHPSSNYILGKICFEENRKAQSLYSLCYFLLLEPQSDRSREAYNAIESLLAPTETIGFSDTGSFTAADLVISFSFAAEELAGEDATETEIFMAKLSYIFTVLEEQKNEGKLQRSDGDELWWDFYVPLFYSIAKSEHIETFCRYISRTGSEEAEEWIGVHNDKVEAFFEWLNRK
jgi:tetratricopeptide (TPR) repeat protein